MRLASVLLLVALPILARAEDAASRTVTVPRLGVGLHVPADWQAQPQGESAALSLAAPSGTRVEIRERRHPDPAGTTAATSLLQVPGAHLHAEEATHDDGSWSRTLRLEEKDRPYFEVAAHAKGEAGREEALRVLGTLDARPFPNPRLHADWRRGWTLEVPEGWRLVPQDGSASFVSPDGACVLAVDAWEDVPGAAAARGVEARMAEAIDLVRKAGLQGRLFAAQDTPEIAQTGVGAGIEARLAGFWVQTEEQRTSGAKGWVSLLVTERFRVTLLCGEQATPAAKAGLEALPTFDPDTLAALRPREEPATAALPSDRFERPDAPPVAFAKPATWKASPGSNQMRLQQYEVPGDPPAEIVVFFFGAGGGGGVEANLDRWKGMMHGGEAPKSWVVEVAEGIRAHLLDATGTYVASGMGGSGTPLHIADARMLAAVIECPGGPLYARGVGPEKAMGAAEADFLGWVRSFRAVK